MKSLTIRVFNYFVAALVLTTFSTAAFGQTVVKSTVKNPVNVVSAPDASSSPVVFEGTNVTCAALNASADPRFSHIVSNNEMKLNFADPNGTYAYTAEDGRVLTGTPDATRSFTISSSSNPGVVNSWSSTRQVTAINVKVGSTSYVYPYKPYALSDSNLDTGDSRGISHITVCYNDAQLNPTAAEGSVSGRVVDTNGLGIAKAQLVLINGETGEAKITLTSPFGYYSFAGVDVGRLYVLNVAHKQYSFGEPQRVISFTDNLTDFNFVAGPLQ